MFPLCFHVVHCTFVGFLVCAQRIRGDFAIFGVFVSVYHISVVRWPALDASDSRSDPDDFHQPGATSTVTCFLFSLLSGFR